MSSLLVLARPTIARHRDPRNRRALGTPRPGGGPAAAGTLRTCLDPRRRQAHSPALARGVPDGRTASRDRTRREAAGRGLRQHGRRGLRPALLCRPLRAAGPGRADRVRPRRVHVGGALQPARGALLPALRRAHRLRAGRAADELLPARGPVRLRRAAAPGAPEPGARPGLAGRRPGAQDGHGRAARPVLHRRGRPAAGQARAGHLAPAHRALPVLDDHERLRSRAHRQPVRPVRAERRLVRGRRRPRPPRGARPQAHVPGVPHPRRDQVRHPPRARLPHAGRLQRHRLPRPRAVAAGRRRGGHRHPGGGRRRELAGRAPLRRLRRVRGAGRRVGPVHDRVLRDLAAVGLDPVAGRPGGARRARRARRRRRGRPADASPTRTRPRRARCRPRPSRAGPAEPALQPRGPSAVAPERFALLQALLAFVLAALRRGLHRPGRRRPRSRSASSSARRS